MIALATTKIGINPYSENSMSSSKTPQFKIGRNVGNTNSGEGAPRFKIGSNVRNRRYAARQPIQTSVSPSAFEKFGDSLGEVLWGSSQLASEALSNVADNYSFEEKASTRNVTPLDMEHFIYDEIFSRNGMYIDRTKDL